MWDVNITKDSGNIKDGEVPQFFSHKNQLFPTGVNLTSTEPSSESIKILLLFYQDIDLVNS
ncbi:MAG: hypothetical protein CMG32_05595 [Candidatus Marinimicrobia bacterium]|nr:hypothetical protein [Candidatus Neomarinimicrobiota bacterium]